MTSMKDAALKYALRGWPVFPCRANKKPYNEHGVLEATTDLDKVDKFWTRWPKANIGLDVGAIEMMVVDLDPGHSLEELDLALGGLPKTKLRQTTPRGGEHLFYELKHGEIVAPSASKLSQHVDVRSFHSYVLLPPSRTSEGTYEWDEEGKPAYRTDEMVRLANIAREKHRDRDTWLIEPDLDENIELASIWLTKDAKISTEGHGGDHVAYATAAMMKSYGLSQETAMELMWEFWNPRNDPPWSEDEIDHLEQKIKNGYSYNTSPPGNMTPAYKVAKRKDLFRPIEKPLPTGREMKTGRFRAVTRDGIDHIPPAKWLIQDVILEDSYAMLYGPPETFKTFVALGMALSIAREEEAWHVGPWQPVTRGPVLYCAGEGRASIKKRIEGWEKDIGNGSRTPDHNFVLLDPPPPPTHEAWQEFIDLALNMSPGGYKLVVIDTVGRSMQGMNENSQEHASSFTSLVQAIQRELGATVLALHHSGHDGGRERGSSVFRADCDTSIATDKLTGDGFDIQLDMVKQKDAPKWKQPRQLRLIEVDLPHNETTLTAVEPPKRSRTRAVDNTVINQQDTDALAETEEILVKAVVKANSRTKAKRAKPDPTRGDDAVLNQLYNKIAAEQMALYPGKEFSQRRLASLIAHDPAIEVSEDSLRRIIANLRSVTGTTLHRCFDPATDKFMWKKPKQA